MDSEQGQALEASRKAILVVDDDEAIRQALGKTFEKAGYRCVTVADGPTALEYLGRERFDLVITDMKMPGMSGTELLRRLGRRKEAPRVIVITAYGCESYERAAERYGVHAYLPKPVSRRHLLDVAREALGNGQEAGGGT